MSVGERVTYRSVLANREFAALVAAQGLSSLGDQLARIAVALLVFERTGSSLGAAATYAVSFAPYIISGPFLSALADRHPRIGVMVACDLLRAPAVLLLVLSDVPTWVYFGVLALLGLLSPPFDSARSALQPEILRDPEVYAKGSGLMNLVLQTAQVAGFLAGGALVALVSARGAIALDAASFLLSAGLIVGLICPRTPAQAREDLSSLFSDTTRAFVYVAQSHDLRRLLMFAVLTASAAVVPEGLAVPTASALGHGPFGAGVLTATLPAGLVFGGLLVLRLPLDTRLRALPALALACPLPLLLSPLVDSLSVLAALWLLAGTGAAVNIIAAAAYVQSSPPEMRARTYGVAIAALQAGQGIALLLGGAVASALGPREGVAGFAALATLSLVLTPGLSGRRGWSTQGNTQIVRSST